MITTIRELRDLIAEKCDFSKTMRVVAHDLGKKADKHSIVYVDKEFPTRVTASPGQYSKKSVLEFAHIPEGDVLMPEHVIAALDDLLEDEPKALIGWVYFFYYPAEYKGLFGKMKRVENSLLDTPDVKNLYLVEDDPNIMVIEAEFGFGSFDL